MNKNNRTLLTEPKEKRFKSNKVNENCPFINPAFKINAMGALPNDK
jgi:hypothetical protein